MSHVERGATPLQEHQPALEPSPGVDVAGGKVGQRAVGVTEVLHEHEVPELDVPVVAAVRRPAVRAPLGPGVEMDLGAGTARPRLTHLPEVLLVEPLDALDREADGVVPDRFGVVVGRVHGDPQPVRVEPGHFGEQLPRPRDRFGLEVVAEAPVAEHLEEGEMSPRAPQLVDVVVLAGQPHALLDRRGAGRVVRNRLLAEEVGDELHHPRVGEHRAPWGGAGSARLTAPPHAGAPRRSPRRHGAARGSASDQRYRWVGASSARISFSRSRIASRPSVTAARRSPPNARMASARSDDTRSGAYRATVSRTKREHPEREPETEPDPDGEPEQSLEHPPPLFVQPPAAEASRRPAGARRERETLDDRIGERQVGEPRR